MTLQAPTEYLCRAVAGDDLEGHAVYVVEFGELADYEPRLRGGQCAAWTSFACDLLLSDWLREQGRWQGRGFACVVHRHLFPTWIHCLGGVLHELAHYLSEPDVSSWLTEDDGVALLAGMPLQWASESTPMIARTDPPWHQHQAPFIRAACHLSHRVESVAEAIRPKHLRFSRPYHPAISEDTWMTALGSELQSTAPIRELLTTPAPAAFNDLWQACTEWWEA